MSYKICKVDGCENKSSRKLMCQKHYDRFRRHGSVEDPIYMCNEKCKADGCEKNSVSKNLCKYHRSLMLKFGDYNYKFPEKPKYCSIDGCDKTVNSLGMCKKHYENKRVYGNPLRKTIREMHGMVKCPEYRVWSAMRQRCYNKNIRLYKNYGGRGIIVCERWKNSFIAFYEDMGPKPFPKAEIDRIDNDGNYEPSNCEWVTSEKNNRHTTRSKLTIEDARNIRIRYKNGERNIDLANEYNINASNISNIVSNKIWKE